MTFHDGLRTLNLPGVALAAEQVGAFRNSNKAAQQGFRTQETLAGALPDALSGAPGARQSGLQAVAGTGDPKAVAAFQSLVANASEAERAEIKADMVERAKLSFAVLNARPEDQPELYEFSLAHARGKGIDVSSLPPQFSPEVLPQLEMALNGALTVGEMVSRSEAKSGPGKVAQDIARGILPAATPLRPPKSPLVSVNNGPQGQDFGNPPKDFVWARDPGGNIALRADPDTGFSSPIAIPIAGGPEQAKREGAASAAEKKTQGKLTQSGILDQDIDRAIELTETASVPVTGVGSFLSVIPGTKAKDLSALLDTIKANIGFDKLQAMREASPTGGALGQVSENENRLLQSVFGSLEQSQSKDAFLTNLRRLKETMLDMVHGPGNRPGQAAPQAGIPDGETATNPQTGEKLIRENGKWVPAQ